MNYLKKEARARVWGRESWLLVSMINYKLTTNIAKNKTVISGNLWIWWHWMCRARETFVTLGAIINYLLATGVCTLPLLWLDAKSVLMCDTPSCQSMTFKSNCVLSCHGLSPSRYNPPSEKNTVWNFSVKLSFGFLSVSSRISEHCFWSLMEFVVGSRKEAFSPFPSPIRETLKKKSLWAQHWLVRLLIV